MWLAVLNAHNGLPLIFYLLLKENMMLVFKNEHLTGKAELNQSAYSQ